MIKENLDIYSRLEAEHGVQPVFSDLYYDPETGIQLELDASGAIPPGYCEVGTMDELLRQKDQKGACVYAVLHAYNETDHMLEALEDVVRVNGLVDKIIVASSAIAGPDDRTREIVRLFARQFPQVSLLEVDVFLQKLGLPYEKGKGGNFTAIHTLFSDPNVIIAHMDTDVKINKGAMIQAEVSPLLLDNTAQVVRGMFMRQTQAGARNGVVRTGGRVSEGVCRPLANKIGLFDNEFNVATPLTGLLGIRASALHTIRMPHHYGAETRLLTEIPKSANRQVSGGVLQQVGHSDIGLTPMRKAVVETLMMYDNGHLKGDCSYEYRWQLNEGLPLLWYTDHSEMEETDPALIDELLTNFGPNGQVLALLPSPEELLDDPVNADYIHEVKQSILE